MRLALAGAVLLLALASTVLTGFVVSSQGSVYPNPAGLGSGAMGGGGFLSLVFPAIALFPGGLLWLRQIGDRFSLSVHARTEMWPCLVRLAFRCSMLSAAFVTLTHWVIFVGG